MPWVDDHNASLVTDLYELTMAAAYHAEGMGDAPATFELWVRRLPPERRFLLAAGLDDALRYLESWRFDDASLDYLRSLGKFTDGFLDHLGGLRFQGQVWAVPEGTPVYDGEPLMRISAPLIQAQLQETFLLNTVGFQTMIASKAARVAIACGETVFIDFGARRSHAADAALKGARAAHIGGAAATSMVLAGREYGIPVTGTMAHSYVQAHPDEATAFEAFARTFPDDAVFLIDTYDTVRGARIAAEVAHRLAGDGITVSGVRLDSGDLADLAFEVREILDDAGLADVQIVASGGLDEHRIAEIVATGAPIDAFGVGTSMTTSEDDPNLDIVYKLVQDERGPQMKVSTGKRTLPGVKQVFRTDRGDTIALADEGLDGEPLLERVMTGGDRIIESLPVAQIRERAVAATDALPDEVRSLEPDEGTPWPVAVSDGLEALAASVAAAHR
jgi:nicotinate phosphoribosyltransferase